VIVLALATMVAVKVTGGNASALSSLPPSAHHPSTSSAAGPPALPAGVLADVVSAGTSALSGSGAASNVAVPSQVSGHPAVLRGADGKPEVLYVGAEYCPFCAAERWALVEALSHFGTFTGLGATHSSSTDIDPDTATFSFYGSSYTSSLIDFVPVELYTNQPQGNAYGPLQTLTPAETRVLDQYDQAPYTGAPGSIPFISIGDHAVIAGASYDPKLLAGLTMGDIATQLTHPASEVAQAVNGTADLITAEICTLTGGQPAPVCTAPAITAARQQIGA
jgi:hypothetical protein